jgi:hypothetical protein
VWELPADPDPIFGQWCLAGAFDLGDVEFGAGAFFVGVVAVEVVDVEVAAVWAVELLGVLEVELLGAAAAPASPAAAPPVASTPAIIVALSILETCIVVEPPWEGWGEVLTIMRAEANGGCRCL